MNKHTFSRRRFIGSSASAAPRNRAALHRQRRNQGGADRGTGAQHRLPAALYRHGENLFDDVKVNI